MICTYLKRNGDLPFINLKVHIKAKGYSVLLTLFSKNVNSNEISQVRTTDRSIVSKIKVDENLMIFINVYAPCIISEKIKFLDDISVYVTSQIQEENTGCL